MKKTFLFLLILILWSFILLSLYFLFFTDGFQQQTVWLRISSLFTDIGAKLSSYGRHADDWNWLLLSFLLSVGVIVFSLNDILLRRFVLHKYQVDKSSFYISGIVWLCRVSVVSIMVVIEIVLLAYLINIFQSNPSIYTLEQLDKGRYDVVLLGTRKFLDDKGAINVYYKERINTTIELWNRDMVRSILISGDHQGPQYSEVNDMRNDLLGNGVPQELMQTDVTGFRTFDSIRKLKKADYGNILIISQQFHLERALYLAKLDGLIVKGLIAKGNMTQQMLQREMFAKTRVLLDVYLFNTQAYGLQVVKRRSISFLVFTDVILLVFVGCCLFLAGKLSRHLLSFHV